ncbi:MAG: UbiH/UbiF/VisC/COQ6 family ubiquinone biosynthesis hydroxylase [Pseudomonadota bacterium]|nr:UbiH/UbiF/VisC/COQ6 family ubiquinone biosynthesis hydroxylase [Pseudomonadota bacterium]
MTQPDVTIVGGGLVGLSLAALLRESGLHIALLESDTLPRWPAPLGDRPFAPRVSALSPASQRILHRCGAWEGITARRATPYRHMHVWDGEGTGSIHFSAAELRVHELGHIVENDVVRSALTRCIESAPNIQVIEGARLDRAAPEARGLRLHLTGAKSLSTQLLVGADGARSRVRDLAGMRIRQWSYGQRAIVTTVRTDEPHSETAWQRFEAGAPLALLPLTAASGDDHFASVVWSLPDNRADAALALGDDEFDQSLSGAFEYRLGRIRAVDRRYSFPLHQCHALRYVVPRVALIGDAAHSIHPLAGQGVNLGLLDAAVLAEEILQGQARGLAPGALAALQRYQRRRQSHNLSLMAAMEGLYRTFGLESLPLQWLRNRGLDLVDQWSPLKNWLSAQATGLQPPAMGGSTKIAHQDP